MIANIKYFIKPIFFILIFAIKLNVFSQNTKNKNYTKYLDSADVIVLDNYKIAQLYLDSIPLPLETNIKNRLSHYYYIKGLINSQLEDRAKVYQDYKLSLKYAELEKNYDIAGAVSLELFTEIYHLNKDTSAFNYLEKSKKYYALAKNKSGLINVMQMPAHIAFLNHNYEKSNALILTHLSTYKNFTEDGYYYMYANFMLATNYIHMGNTVLAQKYLTEFNSLQNNTTIQSYNFQFCQVSLYRCLAEEFFEDKQLDSTFFYLLKASKLRNIMDNVITKDYYNLYSNAYKYVGNTNLSEKYSDSLRVFEAEMLEKTLNSSFQISNNLLETEENLTIINKKNSIHKTWLITLIVVFIILILVGFFGFKKMKTTVKEVVEKNKIFSHLKTKNEKLRIKVQGLEDYLTELKKEFKIIATISDPIEQRKHVKEFYAKIRVDSSIIVDKQEKFIENIDTTDNAFFKKISELYPQLSDDDKIICYYIFIGFKNKEIAVFLNSTVRAIESKRYRIFKKINPTSSEESLTQILESNFKILTQHP